MRSRNLISVRCDFYGNQTHLLRYQYMFGAVGCEPILLANMVFFLGTFSQQYGNWTDVASSLPSIRVFRDVIYVPPLFDSLISAFLSYPRSIEIPLPLIFTKRYSDRQCRHIFCAATCIVVQICQ